MFCSQCRRLVALVLLATTANVTDAHTQTPLHAPLLQTGSRIFALGAPHTLGALARIYGVRWRKDSGAFVFSGIVRPATRVSETKALARGESVPLEDEPTLFVYDLDSARLTRIGRFQVARDQEYFREEHWVGQNLYVSTGVPPSENVPNPLSRLYVYDIKAARATFIAEMPISATLEAAPADAPFLIARYFEDGNQRFQVIADGKVIPVKLGDGPETFGLYGWSVDGSAYYVHGERAEAGAKALEIRYTSGEVRIKSVDFNARRDLFAAQPVAESLFTLRPEKEFPSPGLLSLVGRGAGAPAKSASDLPVTRYDLALSANSDDSSFSLAPNSTALIYVAQETLFLQQLVELQGRAKEAVKARLRSAP